MTRSEILDSAKCCVFGDREQDYGSPENNFKTIAALFSSKTAEWETPQDFFDELNREFHFTLDPCADAQNHKCARYYTKEDDGLRQNWSGETVFCNPPYGREIEAWVRKCFLEVYTGTCRCAVLLLPARTDTKWFHAYVYHKAEVRFIKGRLKFGGGEK